MIIKKYEQAEFKNVIKIFMDVYTGPPWNDQWDDGKPELYLKAFINNPSSINYLAYSNEQLIGVCIGERKYWWQGDEYYINEIFIDKPFQRRGFGSSFLSLIISELKQIGVGTITLLTDKRTPAENFYKANGFQDKDVITFKYINF